MHVCNYFTITNMNHVVTVPPKKYVCVSSLVYKWQMIVEAFNYRRHGTIFCFLHSLLTGTGKDKLSPIETHTLVFTETYSFSYRTHFLTKTIFNNVNAWVVSE